MKWALALAGRGRGWVEPNPMVGAVLVRDGRIIGEGYHRHFGGPHAEVEALRDAAQRGETTAGAELYVTLEPCCHRGKTPPCTEAIIAAQIARVYAAMVDPHTPMQGKGLAQLRSAGIEVHVGMFEDAARSLNEPFIKRTTTGLPWVIAKWAQTLDGRTATCSGNSQWISNERSRRVVHQLRRRVDAVMVGIGTVRLDDPQLTARNVRIRRIARRVVLDPDLKIPADAKLLNDQGPSLTLAVHDAILEAMPDRVRELADAGVEFVGLPSDPRRPKRLLLRPLMEHLAERRHATNVLVEGGAGLIGSLLHEQLVDQVLAFVAPLLLGDSAAHGAVTGFHRPNIANATSMQLMDIKRLNDDVLLDYRVRY